MSKKEGGIGFLGALALLFIGLRLGNVIDWGWLWVLAPLWGVPALILAFMAGCALAAGGAFALSGILEGFSGAWRHSRRHDAAVKRGERAEREKRS